MQTESAIVIDYVLPDRRHSQGIKRAPLPSYTLALLLAQTPPALLGCPVIARVHDEQARGPYRPSEAQPDILCLTYLTTGAPRAYQLSEEARCTRSHMGKPIKIVHGGIHATSLPKEALVYSHIVVRGEITPATQRQVLEYALTMDPSDRVVFRIAKPPATLVRPPADWSWMRRKDYMLAPVVQTSVGCPFHCDFCSVTEVFGAGMRTVGEESLRLELSRLPRKSLLPIIDDNFLQGVQPRHIEHCLRVASILHELGFRWVTEVMVKTLIDAQKKLAQERPGFDLIKFFAEHGCRGFFFGIETVAEGGGGLRKSKSLKETVDLIHHCQSEGMGILGAFVLGVDPEETPDYAKRLLEFAIEEARLDFVQFSINTPMPGARNFVTGIRDGKIFNFDWELYDGEHCVMQHPRMSPAQLEKAHRWLYKEFYAFKSILKRYPLLSLLALSTSLWRRLIVGLPANVLLQRVNQSWSDRISRFISRETVPLPHQTVLDQVRELLERSAQRPAPLFDVHQPDTISLILSDA
jgi:radical SAM superfamily enzyme YgiQ (UPF0313 family)